MAGLIIKPPANAENALDLPILSVKHPGYPSRNLLLRLAAADTDGAIKGIHYDTLHTACAIAAANRFDGYLSASPVRAAPPIPTQTGGIVPAGTYYFHVHYRPGDPLEQEQGQTDDQAWPYPVVASFDDYQFPHGRLPKLWNLLDPPAGYPSVSGDTDRCILTASRTVRRAHIVPFVHSKWFGRNDMAQYGSRQGLEGDDAINDPRNRNMLRDDLHRTSDADVLALVPKLDAEGTTHLVAHFLMQPMDRVPANIHNQSIRSTAWEGRGEIYFARFAWHVLRLMRSFLVHSLNGRAVVLVKNDESYETKIMDPPQLRARLPKSQSGSPQKKQRTATGSTMRTPDLIEDGECDGAFAISSPDWSQDIDNVSSSAHDPSWDVEQFTRGRKRMRVDSEGYDPLCV
ncbi:hypothetical protein ANO11243_067210 [Dothideomycetidae sp. 11243]|nr:hypothetical protein ANO11243_067210 [fungal sp. No.11243]